MFLTSLALPFRVWSWRRSSGVGLLIVVPVAAALGLAHGPQLAGTLNSARALALSIAALVAAALVYAHGRIATNQQSEWLGVAIGVPAIVALVRTAQALTRPGTESARAGDALLVSTLVLGGSTLMLVAAVRSPSALSPLAVSLVPAAVALVVQQLLLTGPPWVEPRVRPVVAVGYAVVIAGLALLLQRLEAVPAWARHRLGCAVLLTGAAGGFGAVFPDRLAVAAAVLIVALVSAELGLATALRLVRSEVGAEQRQLAGLHARLAVTEAARRADRARLHEVNTIVAGLSSASQLAHELPDEQAQELRGLVGVEFARLQRLLDHRGEAGPGPAEPVLVEVDLDEVVGRIAAAHRARGHQVTAPRSGLVVHSSPDDLAAVLDVLVDNAARHGSPGDIRVRVERLPHAVELHVSDRGPGVPLALRPTLFDWAQRRPGSTGEGIGLFSAVLLARRLGGDLRLDDAVAGADFVLHLPDQPERTRPGERLSHAH